jgi:PAS domain S-box-containing protein
MTDSGGAGADPGAVAERQAEAALEAERRHLAAVTLEAVFAAAPLAIFTTDARDRITSWNPAAERIYGYSAAEMFEGDAWSIWRGMDVPQSPSTTAIQEMMLTDGSLSKVEVRRRRKDGTIVDLSLSGATLTDAAGRVIGYVYVADDVTRQRLIEETLRRSERLESIGQLTGGIAHDFNNLLAIIQGNLELIQERVEGPDLTEMVGEALDAALRGAALTHRLLAFSRRQPLAPIVVELDQLLREFVVMLRRVLEESIRIELEAAPDLARAEIDPGQLETALLNLAVNARDAMPEGGLLTIGAANGVLPLGLGEEGSAAPGAPAIVLTVTDTGHGMSRAVAARAAEPFFTTKPVGRGTGLGLSMVYGFAKQSGGHLEIESEPGRGTTIHLFLPAAAGGSAASAAAGSAGAIESVLVVEDDDAVRRLQMRWLEALGHRVYTAADGPSGLAIIEAHPEIGLLLSDVVLPGGMPGTTLARLARAIRPELRIILMSGYIPEAELGEMPVSEMVFLAKPFTRAALKAAIERVAGYGVRLEGRTR